MSTQHTLTMQAAVPLPADQLPMVKLRLDALLREEDVQEAIDNSDFLTYDVDPDGVVLDFEDRWSRQGLVEVARRLSRGYLSAEVRVEISWDTRDSDESGAEAWVYRDGALVSKGATELVMAPVEPDLIGNHVFGGPAVAGNDRAWELLKSYATRADIDDDMAVVVGDIVTDLLHLAHRQGLDFDQIYTRALERHAEEKD